MPTCVLTPQTCNFDKGTPMARNHLAHVRFESDVHVIDMGLMEIWDGADLSLLRDTLADLFDRRKSRSLGVDMAYVKYIPSGFFGMLGDWQPKGGEVRLYAPKPHVKRMLWFRLFFERESQDCYRMLAEPKHVVVSTLPVIRDTSGTWPGDPDVDSSHADDRQPAITTVSHARQHATAETLRPSIG